MAKLNEENRIFAERIAVEKVKTDELLIQCLNYILGNDGIAKRVTVSNREQFLQKALVALEASPYFPIFKNNVLHRENYGLVLYTQCKQEANKSLRDLKLKLYPTECQFVELELSVMLSNAVRSVEEKIEEHERILRAQSATLESLRATIDSQQKVAEAAEGRNKILKREQEEQRRRVDAAQEIECRRADQAERDARIDAHIHTGLDVASFAVKNLL
jgi:hypothetical protein